MDEMLLHGLQGRKEHVAGQEPVSETRAADDNGIPGEPPNSGCQISPHFGKVEIRQAEGSWGTKRRRDFWEKLADLNAASSTELWKIMIYEIG